MQRFYLTMIVYAVLGLLAGFTLEGTMRLAVLIFIGGLALKTWLFVLRKNQE